MLSLVLLLCVLLLGSIAVADDPDVPQVLKPWEDWVTWGVKHRDCPKLYSSAEEAGLFLAVQARIIDQRRWRDLEDGR